MIQMGAAMDELDTAQATEQVKNAHPRSQLHIKWPLFR